MNSIWEAVQLYLLGDNTDQLHCVQSTPSVTVAIFSLEVWTPF